MSVIMATNLVLFSSFTLILLKDDKLYNQLKYQIRKTKLTCG